MKKLIALTLALGLLTMSSANAAQGPQNHVIIHNWPKPKYWTWGKNGYVFTQGQDVRSVHRYKNGIHKTDRGLEWTSGDGRKWFSPSDQGLLFVEDKPGASNELRDIAH